MKLTWHVYPEGVRVWRNGEFIGVIALDDAHALIAKLAAQLQNAR